LQNDVGGVAGVLSNTISSVIGNTVTVIAAFVSMLVLSWQLTIVAVILLPILVIAQRRVGQVRARIATKDAGVAQRHDRDHTGSLERERHPVGEELHAAEGRDRALRGREREPDPPAGESADERPVVLRDGQHLPVDHPGGHLPGRRVSHHRWVDVTAGTIVAFTTVQARLMFPLLGLLRVALDLQTSGALFARIFEYLDLVPAIADKLDAHAVRAGELGRVDFDDVVFRYPDAPADSPATLKGVSFSIAPGSSRRSWGRRGLARPRCRT